MIELLLLGSIGAAHALQLLDAHIGILDALIHRIIQADWRIRRRIDIISYLIFGVCLTLGREAFVGAHTELIEELAVECLRIAPQHGHLCLVDILENRFTVILAF